MNEEQKAKLQKQEETMLAKLSAVMDTKVGQMKRELEEVALKAHALQMTELKLIKFSDRPSPTAIQASHKSSFVSQKRRMP